MYLLYVDAAGTAQLSDQSAVYVLAGICVHEGTWFALEKRVAQLKANYGLAQAELHVKDYCVDIGEQLEIPNWIKLAPEDRREAVVQLVEQKIAGYSSDKTKRNKRRFLKRVRPYAHLARSERTQLLEDTLDLVGSHDGIRLFAEAVDKAHLLKTSGQRSPERHAFTQLVSRFDYFLGRANEINVGVDNGLVVMDREGAQREAFLQDLLPDYRTQGHRWGALKHVIDIPFFAPSQLLSGVQLVDACAYAVRRYVEFRHKSEYEEINLRRIYHRFDRQGPRLHGIRHYSAVECDCLICSDRNRQH